MDIQILLLLGDAGLLVPSDARRIDLAVKPGLPSFLEVLDTILEEMVVEKIVIAEETKQVSPERFEEIIARFPNIPVMTMPHIDFKETTKAAKGYVRTGEYVSYSSIILVAGVTYYNEEDSIDQNGSNALFPFSFNSDKVREIHLNWTLTTLSFHFLKQVVIFFLYK